MSAVQSKRRRRIRPFADKKTLNVIVETPRGRRNKFKLNSDHQVFVQQGIV